MENQLIILQEMEGVRSAPDWIQVLRAGSYNHELFGKLEITKEMLFCMKSNYDSGVRGVDLAIDYAHNSDLEAAGWIKGVELREENSQLWAFVQWTPKGKEKVESQEYRYISADFYTNYKDNETGMEYGCCLCGAALTNRPFIKKMAPTTELKEQTEEIVMEDNKLLQLEDDNKKLVTEKETLQASLTEAQAKLAEIEKKKIEDEKETSFNALLSEGKVVPAQKDSFLKGDINEFIKNAHVVNLKEQGSSVEGTTEESKKLDENKIIEEAKEIMKKEKLDWVASMKKAVRQVRGN